MRALLAAAGLLAECGAVRLRVEQGTLVGRVEADHHGVAAFLGVPFAQPPIADLRWQPPQPAEPYKLGVRQALTYAHSCVQDTGGGSAFTMPGGMSEDCLYLNLWLPKGGALDGPPRPAMIFFYGGSYTKGSAMTPIYLGSNLAGFGNDTVAVAANYRVGALGYLGSGRLRARDGSTGNFGLQDQRMAMRWVRDNAARLNVDPARVMIFGESAGSGSVAAHLVAPRSRGLFTRAALESGPVASWNTRPLGVAAARFDALARAAGCGDAADPAACLRAKSTDELLAAQDGLPPHVAPDGSAIDWSPVVDGVEFTASTEALLARGGAADVPVLLGTNADEGSAFLATGNDVFAGLAPNASVADAEEWMREFTKVVGRPQNASDLVAHYPPSAYAATRLATAGWWAVSHEVGDAVLACPARRTARAVPGPAYLYFFRHKLSAIDAVEAAARLPLGACHGSEIPLVFGHTEILTAAERELSRQIRAYWIAFAAAGDPNAAGAVEWPRYDAATDTALALDMPVETVAGLKRDACDFWDAMGL